MDRDTLEKLKDNHPTSSWALWSQKFPNKGCIEENSSKLFEFIYQNKDHLNPSTVLLSLNPSTSMPSNYQNFHSTDPKHKNHQFQEIIEENGLEGAYMTDLVEEVVEVDSGNVEPSEKDVENLLKQLEILDQDEYHIVCFLRPVFKSLEKYFNESYEEGPHNIKSFETRKNGMNINCYRVWFHANWGTNQNKMPELKEQLSYISSKVERKWTPEDSQGSTRENKLIQKYYDKKGGLVVTEFNVTDGIKNSRQRRLDAVRFPEEEDRLVEYSDLDRKYVNELLKSQKPELIEVHNWGFYVFGQLVGKEEILKEKWGVKNSNKTLLVDNNASGGSYKPDENRDNATHQIFDKYSINVVNLTN